MYVVRTQFVPSFNPQCLSSWTAAFRYCSLISLSLSRLLRTNRIHSFDFKKLEPALCCICLEAGRADADPGRHRWVGSQANTDNCQKQNQSVKRFTDIRDVRPTPPAPTRGKTGCPAPPRPAKLTKSAGRSGAKLTADSIDTPFHYACK